MKKLIKKITKAEVQGLLSEALKKHTAFARMLDANLRSVERFYFAELARLQKRAGPTLEAVDALADESHEEEAARALARFAAFEDGLVALQKYRVVNMTAVTKARATALSLRAIAMCPQNKVSPRLRDR